jgi:hypothetical protein
MSKLAVTALVFVIAMTAARAQQGPWIRHEAGDHGVIVFVHGLLGDERSTWTSGNFYWKIRRRTEVPPKQMLAS